jgi:hypothetical protein
MGLTAAAVACFASMVVPTIVLYSFYCGSLCGEGWALSPFGIAASLILTRAVLSPAAIPKRRTMQIIYWIA